MGRAISGVGCAPPVRLAWRALTRKEALGSPRVDYSRSFSCCNRRSSLARSLGLMIWRTHARMLPPEQEQSETKPGTSPGPGSGKVRESRFLAASYSSKSAIVTGGGGLLGRAVAERLRNLGWRVSAP